MDDGAWRRVRPAPMKEVLEAWLDDLDTRVNLKEVKESTAATYRCNLNKHFLPFFASYKSDQITPKVMKQWRKQMASRVAAGEMAPKSFNNLFTLLSAVLAWARHPAQEYMIQDPLIGQKRLKHRPAEAEFLESNDMAALLKAVASSAEENAITHLGLFAGLRRGEIFALKWNDVTWGGDKLSGRIDVRRNLYRGQVTSPKSDKSSRTVDVPRRVLDVLAAHQVSRPPQGEGFIFRTRTGSPIDPGTWYKRTFVQIRRRAGLRSTVGIHSLRHTYASLLIHQGENPKYISRQLGHALVAFTMDRYGHIFKETSTDAMQRLGTMIPAAPRSQAQLQIATA